MPSKTTGLRDFRLINFTCQDPATQKQIPLQVQVGVSSISKNTTNEGRSGQNVYVLVYSVLDPSSFDYIKQILPILQEQNPKSKFIIVANKKDWLSRLGTDLSEDKKYAIANECDFISTYAIGEHTELTGIKRSICEPKSKPIIKNIVVGLKEYIEYEAKSLRVSFPQGSVVTIKGEEIRVPGPISKILKLIDQAQKSDTYDMHLVNSINAVLQNAKDNTFSMFQNEALPFYERVARLLNLDMQKLAPADSFTTAPQF
ncbi:hypothetical protein BN59_03641 [Legionella massiliensis]|uniref:Ras family protein n=1 Tax=Legionella massiliensis TaxID=1034943 RepID=A0A078L5V2_9GAMM|nr:hypothetical protein [Legionella massiliensis]CDZ79323.1 hypothetical protein BN59_03641 [Legionella massiliensis]CEE15061.1 hypothetical protein BN1094_03641 [Legionella massiliensis]